MSTLEGGHDGGLATAHGIDDRPGEGELTDSLVQAVKVQEGDGVYTITLPKDAAQDLGFKKGDQALYRGKRGDKTLRVGKPENVLND